MQMHKVRNNRKGFTLAEMLIVVAIIVVLAGVSVVGVVRYQRGLKQLELDGIAKEIFVAAQNHLTMAESQGYLGLKEPEGGTAVNPFGNVDDEEKGIYYFVVGTQTDTPASSSYASPDTENAKKTVLSLMLPFASVDETVRLGGSYIVRYQKDPGIVLDVFYAEKNGRYPYTLGNSSKSSEYSLLMSDGSNGYHGANNKGNRRKAVSFANAVLGWYGGEEAAALPTGTRLEAPSIEVINAETLRVIITNPNIGTGHDKTGLKLVVKGLTSSKEIPLINEGVLVAGVSNVSGDVSQITVILDDITSSSNHFTQLFSGDGLTPGEDIEIYAVAYNNTQITDSSNGKSNTEVTNSLFAYDGDGNDLTADIGYIRHLENLNRSISAFAPTGDVTARQINDLSWKTFKDDPNTGSQITLEAGGNATVENCFVPVNSNYNLEYDGQNNAVKGIQVNYNGFGGLFGSLNSGDSVSNLELINFTVAGTTGAGALAGTVEGTAGVTSVSNVVAYNDAAYENYVSTTTTATVTGTGSVGGLIGSLTGGTVTKSAAALVVSSTGGSAGGFIGTATGGTVSASYSGGHTDNGKYENVKNSSDEIVYNVTAASGTAGGLIGNAGSATITNCYSTCSATGATVGGLVGSASGTITNCYATGLVSGTTKGAFAGSLSSAPTDCKYYMIINELSKGAGAGYEYLAPVGGTTLSTAGITALDNDPSSFNRFVQVKTSGSSPAAAKPYDNTLKTTYGEKYDLQSVNRLGASVVPSDFVATHYGDWPSPEIWVINTKTGSTTDTTTTDPITSNVKRYPPYAYIYPILEDDNGTTCDLSISTNQYRFTLTLPSSAQGIVYDAGSNHVYFTQATSEPVELKYEYTNGTPSYSTGSSFTLYNEYTVLVQGVDEDPVTPMLSSPTTYIGGGGKYTLSFNNSSVYTIHQKTVTLQKDEGITITSISNSASSISGNTITLEYNGNSNGINPGNSIDAVQIDFTGTGVIRLIND